MRGFSPLPKPGPNDWLANHPEPGQTYEQWLASPHNVPDKKHHAIYLQPLGTFGKDAPPLDKLTELASAFFMMDVRTLPPIALDDPKLTTRISPMTQQRQYLAGDLLDLLRKKLPGDAYCIVGVTMEDLYPDPSWNFVFGMASLRDRAGVYSFARYGGEPSLLLRRSCKVLAHETLHMFGMAHCTFFQCVLNGSNHLGETDARPMHLCPIDLRKLRESVAFDPVERYKRLREFTKSAGFDDETRWLSEQIAYIERTP